MPNFVVVAFYTIATPYEEEIKGLKRTCDEHGVHCHMKGYENRGKWVRNAAIKPHFIRQMMEQHPGKSIVYLDADARMRKYPDLFDTLDADIGVYWRNRGGRRELLSGTIFLKDTPATHKLMRAWEEAQAERPDEWDQRVLSRVLDKWKEPLKIAELPPTYCQIFDTMRDVGIPVIEHLQASRRFKRLVENRPSKGLVQMPTVYANCKIRQHRSTGEYWIVRPHRLAEKFLDEHCHRVPGQLKWTSRFISDHRIDELHPVFMGKVCHIVGKGPSLDHLRSEHFHSGPVIALNEAIHAVEELQLKNATHALQQDAKLRATCLPKRSPIFVETKAANYYGNVENAYLFQNAALGLNPSSLSVTAAILIAKTLGATSFRLLCFDACVNQKTTYAKRIGYKSTWGGSPERFHKHRSKILRRAKPLDVEWVIPEALAVEADDRSQQ
jgi:hypothetical protein